MSLKPCRRIEMGKDAEKGCYQIDKNLSEVPQSSEGPYSLYLHTDLF